MYTVEFLTNKFLELSDEQQETAFAELTKNAALYDMVMPNIPLIMYIHDERLVPPPLQGPLIRKYIAWKAKQQ